MSPLVYTVRAVAFSLVLYFRRERAKLKKSLDRVLVAPIQNSRPFELFIINKRRSDDQKHDREILNN